MPIHYTPGASFIFNFIKAGDQYRPPHALIRGLYCVTRADHIPVTLAFCSVLLAVSTVITRSQHIWLVARWCSGYDVGRATFASRVPVRSWHRLVISEIGDRLWQVNYIGIWRSPRLTQPCIPPGSLNRVPASAGVKAGSPDAVWQVTLCDPIWHVISRSVVIISITNC